jgi:flagellar basal body-associated protein FliL
MADSSDQNKPEKTAFWLAVAVVILFYGLGIVMMFTSSKTSGIDMNTIYSGLESIAFAAAGFVFGREVNRQRADEANAHATKEGKRASIYQPRWDLVVALATTSRDRISQLQQPQDLKNEYNQLADQIQQLNNSVQNEIRLLQ